MTAIAGSGFWYGTTIGSSGTGGPLTGIGTTNDWDFCSGSIPCTNRQGDCDNDDECVEDYVCGKDNCRDFWSQADSVADCCIAGGLIKPPGNCAQNMFSEVKLVGGSGPHEGNIFVGGLPVCDDYHDAANARVVCRCHRIQTFSFTT